MGQTEGGASKPRMMVSKPFLDRRSIRWLGPWMDVFFFRGAEGKSLKIASVFVAGVASSARVDGASRADGDHAADPRGERCIISVDATGDAPRTSARTTGAIPSRGESVHTEETNHDTPLSVGPTTTRRVLRGVASRRSVGK